MIGSYHSGQVEDKTINAGVFDCTVCGLMGILYMDIDGQEKLVKNNWIIYEELEGILQRCVVV